jgi:tetratricopeptide (TPR) repeat protein
VFRSARGTGEFFRIVALFFVACGSLTGSAAFQSSENASKLNLSVYVDGAPPGLGPSDFAVSAGDSTLKVDSSVLLGKSRPILIIVDPGSYSRTELRRRLSMLSAALAEPTASNQEPVPLRLGFPVLDGILTDPITDRKFLGKRLDSAIESFLPAGSESETGNLGRFLDLVAELVRRSEEAGGPVDCLILARDRGFPPEEADYLNWGSERQILNASVRKGSTFYAYLDESGIIQDLCVASGGIVFRANEPADAVVRKIMSRRASGYTLAVERPAKSDREGRLELVLKLEGRQGAVQGPRALWQSPGGGAVPDHYRMRQALDWIRRAKEAEKDENLTIALRFIDMGLQEDSWNPQAFYLGGKIATDTGDLNLAVSYLTRAVTSGVRSEPALLLYGRVLDRLGRPQEALGAFRASLSSGLNASPAIKLQMARLLASNRQYDEARQAFEAVLDSEVDDDTTRADYGRTLWLSGNKTAAGEQYRLALSKNPVNAAALIHFSAVASSEGNEKEALDLGLRALKAHPKNPDTHSHMGELYSEREKWGPAIDYYRAALAIAPSRRDITARLVDVLVRAGRPAESLDLLRRELESNPSDVEAYRTLARIQARSGQLSEAVATLEGGAAQATKEAHVLYRDAAVLRERRGEYGQALLDYRAMLKSVGSEAAPTVENSLAQHLAFLSLSVNSRTSADKELGPGAAFLPKLEPAPAAAEESRSEGELVIPGGIGLLASTLGVDVGWLREPEATERVFSFMLEVSPSHSERLQDNPLRRDLIAYLRHYDDLINHMRKRGLLPAEFDPFKGHEFVFPLIGAEPEVKKTQQFLSFFGVGLKVKRSGDNDFSVNLTLKENRGATERQQLLRNLGINLLDRNLRELRFRLRNDKLPLLYDEQTWSSKILANEKAKSKQLLGRLVLSARAMNLYVALAACSDATREGLIKSTGPGELLSMSEALSTFGRHLDFKDGQLVVPGRRETWEEFLSAKGGAQGSLVSSLLRRDQGKGLLLYYTLSVAPKPVQDFFTASSQRLNDIYQTVALGASIRPSSSASGAGKQDPARVLRQLSADSQGLLLLLDQRFRKFLTPGTGTGDASNAADTAGMLRVTPKQLPKLLDQGTSPSPAMYLSVVDMVEFLKYVQSENPAILTEASIAAIMHDPALTPSLLDLVWDLNPSPELSVKYLAYCRDLAQSANRTWNANKNRTSQSLFYLLSLLYREGTLSAENARKLLEAALERFSSPDEGTFAMEVARFLAEQLLPAIKQSLPAGREGAELVLQGLAGTNQPREFVFEGKQLQLDLTGYKLQRMKTAIQQQVYTPLEQLLEIYAALLELQSGKPAASAALQNLEKGLRETKGAEFSIRSKGLTAPENTKALKQSVAHVEIEPLRQKVVPLSQGNQGQASISKVASEIASALHTELSITLLSYCYAYHGSPETDALAFDPNFIRKHDFSGQGLRADTAWGATRLEQKEGVGTSFAGSVSGLGFELSRLETAQSVQSFGRREGRGLVPTLLTGMRIIRPSLRSDRAQEYVALSVRLGREILALSAVNATLRLWCENFLRTLVSPRRRERALQLVQEGNARAAGAVLSASELFFIGEAYLASFQGLPQRSPSSDIAGVDAGNSGSAEGTSGNSSNGNGSAHGLLSVESSLDVDCPVLVRIKEIIPAQGSSEAQQFRREVEQYGILLRRRVGLSQLSFSLADSYEQLERNSREELLYERICDLKIKIAELSYSLGLPAYLGEVLGELAVRDILPQSAAVRTNSWKLALEQIGRLEPENARNWVEELLNRGILAILTKAAAEK